MEHLELEYCAIANAYRTYCQLQCPRERTCQGTAKILMLHGHGQSGSFFYWKTRPLHRSITTAISSAISGGLIPLFPRSIEFFFPSGPHRASQACGGDTYTWGTGDFECQEIAGLDRTIQSIIDILDEHGPFIGIIGFSTGAAIAAIVTSLLEKHDRCPTIRFQTSHPPPQFVIGFSGFMLLHPRYRSLYYPPIETPMMHFIAQLDAMIPGHFTEQLASKFCHSQVRYFWGTHYVPRDHDTIHHMSGFISRILEQNDSDTEWVDI